MFTLWVIMYMRIRREAATLYKVLLLNDALGFSSVGEIEEAGHDRGPIPCQKGQRGSVTAPRILHRGT